MAWPRPSVMHQIKAAIKLSWSCVLLKSLLESRGPWVQDRRAHGIAVPADTDCQETLGSTVQTCPSVPQGQGEPHSFV